MKDIWFIFSILIILIAVSAMVIAGLGLAKAIGDGNNVAGYTAAAAISLFAATGMIYMAFKMSK